MTWLIKLLTCFFQAALLHTPCNTIESGGRHKSVTIEQMRGIKPLVGEERSLSFITNCWRLSQTASKVYTGYIHAPILHLSNHQQHKANDLPCSAHRSVKEGGSSDQWSDMRSRFLSITLVEHGCSVSDKFYRLQHFWYNVVMAWFARFPRFLFLIVKSRKFVTANKICYHYIVPEVLQPVKVSDTEQPCPT